MWIQHDISEKAKKQKATQKQLHVDNLDPSEGN